MVAEEVSWLVDHRTYNISTGALHRINLTSNTCSLPSTGYVPSGICTINSCSQGRIQDSRLWWYNFPGCSGSGGMPPQENFDLDPKNGNLGVIIVIPAL